ncbi:MAG: hypothetical protein ABIG42_08140, partial [bacterium]
ILNSIPNILQTNIFANESFQCQSRCIAMRKKDSLRSPGIRMPGYIDLVVGHVTHKSEDGCVGGTRLTKSVISIEKLNL